MTQMSRLGQIRQQPARLRDAARRARELPFGDRYVWVTPEDADVAADMFDVILAEADRLAERVKELEKVVKAAKRMRREFPIAMDPLTIEDAWAIARRFDVALAALPAHQEDRP